MSAFSTPTFAVVPALQRNITHLLPRSKINSLCLHHHLHQQLPPSSVFHLVLEETLLTVLAF